MICVINFRNKIFYVISTNSTKASFFYPYENSCEETTLTDIVIFKKKIYKNDRKFGNCINNMLLMICYFIQYSKYCYV